jgi:hypothetical protein
MPVLKAAEKKTPPNATLRLYPVSGAASPPTAPKPDFSTVHFRFFTAKMPSTPSFQGFLGGFGALGGSILCVCTVASARYEGASIVSLFFVRGIRK